MPPKNKSNATGDKQLRPRLDDELVRSREGADLEIREVESEASQSSPELLKLKFEFELKLRELEAQENQKQRELEAQEKQRQREHEVTVLEKQLELERLRSSAREGGRRSPPRDADNGGGAVSEIDVFAKRVRGVLEKMPTAPEHLPSWFRGVETDFELLGVPEELRGALLMPFLNSKGRGLISHLNAEEKADYRVMKREVLNAFRLSPEEYYRKVSSSVKDRNESWCQFVTRLADLYRYYLDSRKVTDLESAISLFVADLVKSKLPLKYRQYVLLQEGDKNWLKPEDIAVLCQKYEESQCDVDRPARMGGLPEGQRERADKNKGLKGTGEYSERPGAGKTFSPAEQGRAVAQKLRDEKPRERSCWGCGAPGHLERNCPQAAARKTEAACKKVCRVGQELDGGGEKAEASEEASLTARVAALVGSSYVDPPENGDKQPQGEQSLRNECPKVELSCDGKRISAVLDSGAELTVVKEDLIPSQYKRSKGKVTLVSAFGERVTADLVNVPFRKIDSATEGTALLTVAITGKLAEGVQVLLCPEDWEVLKAVAKPDGEAQERPWNWAVLAVQEGRSGENAGEGSSAERQTFKEEQKSDGSLAEAWRQAQRGSNGMVILDGLLYHRDKVYGRDIRQLVLPRSRRPQVLELAHQATWAAHLGSRKTLQRIRASFFWPALREEVTRYCQSCQDCQRRARPRRSDRVPIQPLARPEEAYQVVVMDIAGPIEPPSSRGHRYALVVVDLCTRWPEVVLLRSATAKATCDGLLRQVFSRMGLPEEICSDMGTNFTAELSQEMMKVLGVEVRFSTPGHPQSNGLVERFIGTFKNMLSHVVRERGRQWDLYVPYVLWAYREVPNETLGVPPFTMMYGRTPRGPLSVLQRTWSGEIVPPVGLNTSTEKFLKDLREKFEIAESVARETASRKQDEYVKYYNMRARPKKFEVGDAVLVQKTSQDNRLDVHWEGPLEIAKQLRENSYLVCWPNGSRRAVHANKIRPFYSAVESVGVAFEDDVEFGELECMPKPSDQFATDKPAWEQVISSLNQFEQARKEELLRCLRKYEAVFSERPGRVAVGEHRITLRDGFTPDRAYPYRIPLALRKEVEKQIRDLLEQGLIEPSTSPHAYPVVCVGKRDGGVRMCVDFRRLNAGTVPDAFPMPHLKELILRVAKANIITLLDMTRGYYQIPVEPASREKTAFVTHRGQYQWRVMPFGLRNAAATFQRVINKLLTPHSEYAVAYIDDIAVFSASWEDHMEHLEAVLDAIKRNGLTAKLQKCKFGQRQVAYLGHLIGSGKHEPDPDRASVIRQMGKPTTKTAVRRFLGMCSYYREYIPAFAEIARPLTDLTGRRVPTLVPWTAEAEEAFNTLVRKLSDVPYLRAPDISLPFLLVTDASNHAVGACLAQKDQQGQECPVAFASEKLNSIQRRWPAIEREAYAIVWALRKFHTIVYGTEITVISDHNPLSYLTLSTPKSPKLVRWALALQQYDVQVVHRRGSQLVNADFLSRIGAESFIESDQQ